MIIVIQCAASKRSGAGRLLSPRGKPIVFVANPQVAPKDQAYEYARPDDLSGKAISWRQKLLRYNQKLSDNPLGLCPAWQLYRNPVYENLANRFGMHRVFILSAGWGLIRSDFLTPYYDITFSTSAELYKRRRKCDQYDDFQMLPDDASNDILFFGGRDYVPLFCALTEEIKGTKTVFYNSTRVPEAPGCVLKRFNTTARTNWHYQCVNSFLNAPHD